MPGGCGKLQGSLAAATAEIDFCALFKQQGQGFQLTLPGCQHERGNGGIIVEVNIRAMPDQHPGRDRVFLFYREQQRRHVALPVYDREIRGV